MKERFDWDWAGAEHEYRRAIELNPNYASAHHRYGIYLDFMGRFDEALREIKQALQLDPLSLVINADLGFTYYVSRQNDPAIRQLQKTLEIDPVFPATHGYLAVCYAEKKMYTEAIDEAQRLVELRKGNLLTKAELAYVYALSGRRDEAQKILEEFDKPGTELTYVGGLYKALTYAVLGEKDRAFALLEKAYTNKAPGIPRAHIDPGADTLRSDPRFADLMKRAGLAP
jgi:Flp pilus assembly protein TadD